MAVVLSRLRMRWRRKRVAHLWLRWRLLAQTPKDAQTSVHGAQHTPTLAIAIDIDYERFIHQHERVILNYLWRMTGDEETAFDLTQEVFLRAWQRFETIRTYDQPVS